MYRELRKNRNNLLVSGMGVIAFTAWGGVKSFLLLFLTKEGAEAIGEVSAFRYGVAVLLSLLSFTLIVTAALNIYVGLSAISEGKGKKRKNYYVAAAVVLTVIRLIGVISDLFFSSGKSFSVMDKLATIIVDITSLIMMADLTVSAIKIRRLFPNTSSPSE